MSTLDEVARHAGVSVATASRALRGRGRLAEATRARVRQAAAELGYVASATAASLATGRTRSIGVLVPLVDQWFFAQVIDGIASRLASLGYDVMLYNATDDPAQRAHLFDTALRRGRVDALIVLSLEVGAAEVASLRALGLPLVGLGTPSPQLATLRVDDVAVARVATEHLLALGHRDIAHLGRRVSGEAGLDVTTLRWDGFARAMADAGARARFAEADYTAASGHRAARELLTGTHPPTAIFTGSDELAFGAIFAARELGLSVPGDLSVVGVDGHDLSALFGLTTVVQFPHAQGVAAADAALAALGEEVAAPASALPFDLVVRSSTAPPRP